MEDVKINIDKLRDSVNQVKFIPGERPMGAPEVKLEDGTLVHVLDAQQRAILYKGELAYNRSISGCTILEVEFEDYIEVFHILAGTFSILNRPPNSSSYLDASLDDRIFAMAIQNLGKSERVKKLKYFINQIHSGMAERRRRRIVELNSTVLANVSENIEIHEISKQDGSETSDLLESVDLVSNGIEARVIQEGYVIKIY